MISLDRNFTSTGAKLFHHQEVMHELQAGKGHPIVTHLMPTDICQHTCAFCSVQARDKNVLKSSEMLEYIDKLIPRGLKAVIISGGGNPLLYSCPERKWIISDLILALHERGLEIGMITNGMKMRDFHGRRSYVTLEPAALDCLTWLRVSMAGLDHEEKEVFVPDLKNTTLGFSYIYHDIYFEPQAAHGKVSTTDDLITRDRITARIIRGEDRLVELTAQLRYYLTAFNPFYIRLLPNCLEVDQIPTRIAQLEKIAKELDPNRVFVQYKMPRAPRKCFLGYVHPVLNSDGYVYPCDSCVLNKSAGHKFAKEWRICHWSEIDKLYDDPVRSLVDPQKLCPGCVFTASNEVLTEVVEGMQIPAEVSGLEHVNFV